MAAANSLEYGLRKLLAGGMARPRVQADIALKNELAGANIDSAYAQAGERDASAALSRSKQTIAEAIQRFALDPANGLAPATGGLYNPYTNNPQQASAADLGFQKEVIITDVMDGTMPPGDLENALSVIGGSAKFDASGRGRYTGDITPDRERMDTAKIDALKALVTQRGAAAAKSARTPAKGGFTAKDVLAGYERDYPKDKKGKGRVNLLRPGEPIPTRGQYAAWYGVDLGYQGPELSEPPAPEEDGPSVLQRMLNAIGLGDDAPAEDLGAAPDELDTGADDPDYQDALDAIEAGAPKDAVNARRRAAGLTPIP